eukprot:1426501-Rhodomonas_salina.2
MSAADMGDAVVRFVAELTRQLANQQEILKKAEQETEEALIKAGANQENRCVACECSVPASQATDARRRIQTDADRHPQSRRSKTEQAEKATGCFLPAGGT